VLTAYGKKLTISKEINGNQQGGRLTIEPSTFLYLKEIELKTMKIQQKNQQWVTIT